MEGRKGRSKKAMTLLGAVLICSLSIALWLTVYLFDNKYTAEGPKGLNGVLTIDEQSIRKHPAIFLVDGWEYYSGQLLAPGDFLQNPPDPDRYIFIGRFGGFDEGDTSSSPHGEASYRLVIEIPEETRTYTLELPEIFSAYQLYVNGKPAASMGGLNPWDYRPETGNQTVMIEEGGRVELLLAVADYSHLYSGMVYPPAFGEPNSVAGLLNARIVFRSILCTAALLIGLLSVLVSLLDRKNVLAVLYGMLCLLLIGYICYPIVQTFIAGYGCKYVIENVSFYAMLAVVTLLTRRGCRVKTRWSWRLACAGGLLCLAAVGGPWLWRAGNLHIMLAWSFAVSAYEWSTALFITAAAIYGVAKDTIYTKPLLYGILIFDTALVTDRLLPLHEPIVTGWFVELASFILALSVGVSIWLEVAARYRDTAIITERASSMERLYKHQQTYYTVLKQEMEESKRMRHDMRHHFTVMEGLIQKRRYDKLSGYLSECKAFCANGDAREYCLIDVINVLAHHYGALAQENRIHFDMRCDLGAAGVEQKNINISDTDMCCLFSNLMENAIEACLRVKTGRRSIRAAIVRPGIDSLTIRVWNSTDGEVKTDGDSFLSSKGTGRKGYGISSIRAIAEKYDGSARFCWDKDSGEFESAVIVIA